MPRTPSNRKSDELSLFIFIDALGWQLIERHGLADDLLVHQTPMDTILGYSCTCDPTILTGQLPREHGHFSFYRYDPANSPFQSLAPLRWLPSGVSEAMRVRSKLSQSLARLLGYTGYFHLYQTPFHHLCYLDYTEKRDLYQPGGIINGSPTIIDRWRENQIPFYLSDWRRRETENIEALHDALDAQHPRVAYLYLAELDGKLHHQGVNAPAIGEHIAFYGQAIKQLYSHARQHYGQVNLFVFSDHGMADVTGQVDLMTPIAQTGLKYGVDYGAVYDSTMARFWFVHDRAQTQITKVLQDQPQGRILSDEALRRYGCDFADQRYGHLFYLLPTGTVIAPSFMGKKPVAAMHGYAPEAPESTASFCSNLPISTPPDRLEKLYPLMLRHSGLDEAQ